MTSVFRYYRVLAQQRGQSDKLLLLLLLLLFQICSITRCTALALLTAAQVYSNNCSNSSVSSQRHLVCYFFNSHTQTRGVCTSELWWMKNHVCGLMRVIMFHFRLWNHAALLVTLPASSMGLSPAVCTHLISRAAASLGDPRSPHASSVQCGLICLPHHTESDFNTLNTKHKMKCYPHGNSKNRSNCRPCGSKYFQHSITVMEQTLICSSCRQNNVKLKIVKSNTPGLVDWS